ncbi:hypothetical protein OAT80_00140 [Flavobacteriaceae bacterium]|nr:hypothetical protein [Flavobacteriaceae bacterium]
MKKLILLLKFVITGLTIRNLFIIILGGTAMLLFLFIIQVLIFGDLDNFWDDDLIFPIIMGATLALLQFEKPVITWEEYWKKNS